MVRMTSHTIAAFTPVNGHTNGSDSKPRLDSLSSNGVQSNGTKSKVNRSHLRYTPVNQIYDLLCVGFGPASLAIAVAIHDALDASKNPTELSSLQGRLPKVAFLERQPSFSWHAGMLLEGSKMQISFIKDMATLRDPRSAFTFLNYLHKMDRLVAFTNLSTFLPSRIEYEHYMRWCASWFEEVAEYGQDVIDVRPEKRYNGAKTVDLFAVMSRNTRTQQITTRLARHVVIAAGGKPNIPRPFPEKHPRVLHSSQYTYSVPQILTDRLRPYKIAVFGAGQSAAEIFENLHHSFPNSQTRLVIRGAALKPSDDSPFVNEVFDPDRVASFYNSDAATRASAIVCNRATNYGVVRLELLERLYETLYMQRLRYSSEQEWPHRILTYRSLVHLDDSEPESVKLYLHDESKHNGNDIDEIFDVDLVIVAYGYTRNTHEDLMQGARHLIPGGDRPEKKWTVDRDYRVQFEEGKVGPNAGVWLQGCNEHTHGLSDTLLSILAVRGGELVQSIFGGKELEKVDTDAARLNLNEYRSLEDNEHSEN